MAALDKCLIHCFSLLCPLWISSSDILMQRLLPSYAVRCVCVCERVCKTRSEHALSSVGGVGCNEGGGWCGHMCDDEWLSILLSLSPSILIYSVSHCVSLGAPATLQRGCRHTHTHTHSKTVLCWHGTAGHCPRWSPTMSDISASQHDSSSLRSGVSCEYTASKTGCLL